MGQEKKIGINETVNDWFETTENMGKERVAGPRGGVFGNQKHQQECAVPPKWKWPGEVRKKLYHNAISEEKPTEHFGNWDMLQSLKKKATVSWYHLLKREVGPAPSTELGKQEGVVDPNFKSSYECQ